MNPHERSSKRRSFHVDSISHYHLRKQLSKWPQVHTLGSHGVSNAQISAKVNCIRTSGSGNWGCLSFSKLLKCTDRLEKIWRNFAEHWPIQLEILLQALGKRQGQKEHSIQVVFLDLLRKERTKTKQHTNKNRAAQLPTPTLPPPLVNLFMPCLKN